MEDNCIFCKIIKGEIPSYKIYEDDNFLAFLDIAQFTEGHTVVVPKKHFEVIWDVDNIDEYIKVAQKIANHYRNIGYKFVDTLIFGRLVKHSHIHLVPHNDDDLGFNNALSVIGEMQRDSSRHPSKERGNELVLKFKL